MIKERTSDGIPAMARMRSPWQPCSMKKKRKGKAPSNARRRDTVGVEADNKLARRNHAGGVENWAQHTQYEDVTRSGIYGRSCTCLPSTVYKTTSTRRAPRRLPAWWKPQTRGVDQVPATARPTQGKARSKQRTREAEGPGVVALGSAGGGGRGPSTSRQPTMGQLHLIATT